ncbi:LPS export ABC transporter permease LptF [Thiospirillum jenense]|uniref:Lipopolysaccharide export system permease protein LptF n=1 Tax=Thiospirillum jenense TaxID=1653858 RepID=A0A839HGD6_9GAMM|nr:LPS export ABC transporter permease LptF [Thiospirillum jenense]MBB1126198.1 LPS export ABC transporter permease LptF [Thiospirillum jenense]
MLTILDRYVLTEVAKVFTAIMVTLLLVTMSLLFLRTLEEINLGALNTTIAFRFLGYQLLRDSAQLLPPAFFVSTLMALGRMARDSELIAVQACGIGTLGLYRALLYFAIPLAILTAWLALIIQPYAAAQIQTIRDLQQEQATQIAGIRAGRYYQQADGQVVFYAAAINQDKHFQGIFLQDQRHVPIRLILAEAGYYNENLETGERSIVLYNGRRYDGNPGTGAYSIGEFSRYHLHLPDNNTLLPVATRKQSSKPTRDLFTTVETTMTMQRANRAELEHRVANPIAVFALLLIAIPLITLSPRHAGNGRWLLAFFAYFAFFNLQRLAENWLENGVSPLWLGSLWYQIVVVVIVIAALVPSSFWLKRLESFNPMLRSSQLHG